MKKGGMGCCGTHSMFEKLKFFFRDLGQTNQTCPFVSLHRLRKITQEHNCVTNENNIHLYLFCCALKAPV